MQFILLVALFCSLLSLPVQAQRLDTRLLLGESCARERIAEVVQHPDVLPTTNALLTTSALAIATVEPLLFATYGKRNIIRQRPYEVYLVNTYWYIAGTIPKHTKGGGFEIILSANNGQILSFTHGK